MQDDYLPNGHIQPDNYSDQVPTKDAPNGMQPDVVLEPRWDSWYRLLQPLYSTVSPPACINAWHMALSSPMIMQIGASF